MSCLLLTKPDVRACVRQLTPPKYTRVICDDRRFPNAEEIRVGAFHRFIEDVSWLQPATTGQPYVLAGPFLRALAQNRDGIRDAIDSMIQGLGGRGNAHRYRKAYTFLIEKSKEEYSEVFVEEK